jgi:hypothetical protein
MADFKYTSNASESRILATINALAYTWFVNETRLKLVLGYIAGQANKLGTRINIMSS